MKYEFWNWDNKKVGSDDCDIKEAVRYALRNETDVEDENGDIIFSQWDGWNGDYPYIEKISFPVADMSAIYKAKQFLFDTKTFYHWNQFESDQFYNWIGKEWLHSDRWSAAYDWVNDGKFDGVELPDNIIECLVEYWETNALHIKVGI